MTYSQNGNCYEVRTYLVTQKPPQQYHFLFTSPYFTRTLCHCRCLKSRLFCIYSATSPAAHPVLVGNEMADAGLQKAAAEMHLSQDAARRDLM